MQGMFRNERALTVSGDLASSVMTTGPMNTKQSDQEMDEIEDTEGPFPPQGRVQYLRP